jgi:hypothetical protein
MASYDNYPGPERINREHLPCRANQYPSLPGYSRGARLTTKNRYPKRWLTGNCGHFVIHRVTIYDDALTAYPLSGHPNPYSLSRAMPTFHGTRFPRFLVCPRSQPPDFS